MKPTLKEIISLTRGPSMDEPSFELPDGSVVLVRRSADDEIENIHSLTQSEITVSTVSLSVIKAVHNHNKDSIWGIYHATDATKQTQRLIGHYSFLHLNQAGLAALERGELNASDPDLSLVARDGERPAAIYVWGVVARRVARIGTPLIAVALGKKRYGGLPIYTTAGSMGGLNTIISYGFSSARPAETGLGDLFRLDPPVPARSSTEAA